VRPTAEAKRIAIDFSSRLEQALLIGDADRLQQVAWNLLSNALKFTDSGGAVSVTLEQRADRFVLTVSDNGRGIEPAFLPFVFDRFKQADSSTTRRMGGLGLGLAIVRHLVEQHGGQVSVVSQGLGQGAAFAIELPIRAVVAAPGQAPDRLHAPEHAAPGTLSLAGLRVLLAEDEPDARELLSAILVRSGAAVAAAASAAAAFQLLKEFRPHVIVSDIAMPGEDGLSLMRRIRALAVEQCGRTPSIALTAYARAEDRAAALAAGFTTHIGKPVEPDDLIAAVSALRAPQL
jgi:CheY-like chemotaxis protein